MKKRYFESWDILNIEESEWKEKKFNNLKERNKEMIRRIKWLINISK
jgi:hypothetical protein